MELNLWEEIWKVQADVATTASESLSFIPAKITFQTSTWRMADQLPRNLARLPPHTQTIL